MKKSLKATLVPANRTLFVVKLTNKLNKEVAEYVVYDTDLDHYNKTVDKNLLEMESFEPEMDKIYSINLPTQSGGFHSCVINSPFGLIILDEVDSETTPDVVKAVSNNNLPLDINPGYVAKAPKVKMIN